MEKIKMVSKAGDLVEILGKTWESIQLEEFKSIFFQNGTFESKELGGVLYKSVKSNGISLQFERGTGSSEVEKTWTCQAIDLYNQTYGKGWNTFSKLPLHLTCSVKGQKESKKLRLTSKTQGVEWVEFLGEPDRKGGGEPLKGGGASGLGPGAWMEWRKVKVQMKLEEEEGERDWNIDPIPIDINVELTGPEVRGNQRWEKDRAGSASWGVITFSL